MKKWIAILLVLAMVGILIVSLQNDAQKLAKEEDIPIAAEPAAPAVRVITKSLFFQEYAAEGGSIANDLEAVQNLLTNCQLIIKNFDSFFLPDNKAITSFLRGGNPEKIAWIPPDHPSINRQGELVDRNDVPVFFHRESGLRFQIRSAGEDRVMWTPDDVVFPKKGN